MNFYLYRVKNRLSQEKAAKVIGQERKAYARKEAQPERFTVGDTLKLAKAYKVSVGELIGEE